MDDAAIRIKGLGKRYRIGEKNASYKTFRDAITNAAMAPFRWHGNRTHGPDHDYFWALKDVSFDVNKGDVVGIIGRNGAGKSTLLKILSKITEPTEGRAELHGRVGSLLEVGTGFHPELTGRENIYMSGSMLGMKRAEINRKFDEIVKFAEMEQFLDMQLKNYSSGMQVRLGFAVASHLEPEILIIDEVLAVGDATFQKKCLGKMGDVAKDGRTVLFVSHNMAAVENLCNRGVVIDHGRVQYMGDQTSAITQYLKNLTGRETSLKDRKDRTGNGELRITNIAIKDTDGNPLSIIKSGQDIDIYLYYETKPGYPKNKVLAGVHVKTYTGIPLFLHHNRLTRDEFTNIPPKGAFVCHIEKIPLPQSTYSLGFSIMANLGYGEYLDSISDAVDIDVVEGDYYGSGEIPPSTHGYFLVPARWRIE